MRALLARQWFLPVLVAVVAFGYLCPGPGIFIKDRLGLDAFIFAMLLLMSFTLETGEIGRAITNFKGLAISVGTGYVVIGALDWLAAATLFRGSPDLAVGLLIVGAVPCTLVSAAVWTRLAGGNDALALAATVTSNVANFLVAPVMLSLSLGCVALSGGAVDLPVGSMVWKLFVTVLVPVTLGQILRLAGLRRFADRAKGPVGVIGRLIVLSVVLTAGSALGSKVDKMGWGEGPGTILMLEVVIAAVHVAAMLAAYRLMSLARQSPADRLAAVFAGSQKTLPLAILLATAFFAASPFAVLPPLLFHVTQLVIDSLAMGYVSRLGQPAPARAGPGVEG